jgi:hypothetical protein
MIIHAHRAELADGLKKPASSLSAVLNLTMLSSIAVAQFRLLYPSSIFARLLVLSIAI